MDGQAGPAESGAQRQARATGAGPADLFACPRGCLRLPFSGLAHLPELSCPRCQSPLVPSADSSRSRSHLDNSQRSQGASAGWRDSSQRSHFSTRSSASGPPPSSAASRSRSERAPIGPTGLAGVRPGARLGGYLLHEELGRGANGVVFKAVSLEGPSRRPVALKVLQELDEESLARFQLEVAVVQRLDEHVGIVRVLDHGHDRGRHYLVMELCPGPSMKSLVDEQAPLAPERATALILQIARAVGFAHDHGVLHRDLKPANVIMEPDTGRPRVTDFGLAADRSLRRSLTASGEIRGTPTYMAPEAFYGARRLDARADVYSLGVMLYRCLTGHRPFAAPNLQALAKLLQREDPPPLSRYVAGIPPDLEALCLRAMARDPADRYPDAGALAAALERLPGALTLERAPIERSAQRLWGLALGVLGVATLGLLALALRPRGPAVAPPTSAPAVSTPASTPASALPAPSPPAPSPSPSPSGHAPTTELAKIQLIDQLAGSLPRLYRPIRLGMKIDGLDTLFETIRELSRRHPDDPLVGVVDDLYRLTFPPNRQQVPDPLGVRRQGLRAVLDSRPSRESERLTAAVARLSWAMGFQRAGAELVRPLARRDVEADYLWPTWSAVQLHAQAEPPVQDPELARRLCDRILDLRSRYRGDHDALLPSTWLAFCYRAGFWLAEGDEKQAERCLDAAYNSTRFPLAQQLIAQSRNMMVRGPLYRTVGPFEAELPLQVGFARDLASLEYLPPHAKQLWQDLGQRYVGYSQTPEVAENPAWQCLALARAGRAFFRVDRTQEAIEALERAVAVELAPRDHDVQALARRLLARALLEQDPARAAEQAEAAAAPRQGVDYRTPGERADAYLIAVQAYLAQERLPAVRRALSAARALAPVDRRQLDELARKLR